MPRLKLSNLFRRGADRQSLKERAATLRANVGALIHAKAPQVAEPSAAASAGPDAELLALAPVWEAAVSLEIQRVAEENAAAEAPCTVEWPGPAPADSGPKYEAWRQEVERWRMRSGVRAAEMATGEAAQALHGIELRIARMPATTLAGMKLKARVAQRSDDDEAEWPKGLGEGLARDILALPNMTAAEVLTDTALSPARQWAVEQAAKVDLSGLDILRLHNLYGLFARTADIWCAASCAPWAQEEPREPWRALNAGGELIMREEERAAEIRDRIVSEIRAKAPTGNLERDWRLEILVQYELLCEGSLRAASPELRAEINKAWGG